MLAYLLGRINKLRTRRLREPAAALNRYVCACGDLETNILVSLCILYEIAPVRMVPTRMYTSFRHPLFCTDRA